MSTRDDVLASLRAAAESGASGRDDAIGAGGAKGAGTASGEAIARDLGLSRAAVAKHVAALRAQGYRIEAVAGSGYRLAGAPDSPIPSEVAPLVRDSFWVRIEGGDATGSTNDDARVLARAGAPEGTVVVAGSQTAGRGRLGREWASPPGGVYLSVVLRPPTAAVAAAPLALAVGLGVAEALESLGADPRLKWPNDVLLGGGKVAGVLLELSAEADRIEWVIAGVGMNIRQPRTGSIPGAAYLASEIGEVRRPEVAAAVLDGIAAPYRTFVERGFGALRVRWNELDALRDREVLVRDAAGAVLAQGVAHGIDHEGRLLVDTEVGIRRLSAGEVTLRPA